MSSTSPTSENVNRKGPSADRPRVRACPVCGATKFTARFERNNIPIESCDACGLALQNSQPSDSQLAEIYGPNYFIGSDQMVLAGQFEVVKRGTAQLQLDEIGAYLARHSRSQGSVRLLEIGCGHGNMLLEARARGYDVRGLEYSADAASVANAKLGASVVSVGTTSTMDFPDRSFDVCVLADVIEHSRDPRSLMSDIWRILDDHAVVFIATPSLGSWSSRVLGRYWMEYKAEHLFYFEPATIKKLLAATGFGDIEVTKGRKVLTLEYIIGHLDKFPVPIISGALRFARRLTPASLLEMKMKIIASGINVCAMKV